MSAHTRKLDKNASMKPRTVGRPQANAGTVRIFTSGLMRLSPDLCTAKSFSINADKEKKQLIVTPDGEFKLREHGRSGLLTIGGTLAFMKIDPRDVAQEYHVKVASADGFVVQL
jgi:hypothetical protein